MHSTQYIEQTTKEDDEIYGIYGKHTIQNKLGTLKLNYPDILGNDISNYIKIVFPIHPRTEKILRENKIELSKKIQVIEPQGYIDFTNLLINSNFAMSDSGTIQEEAVIYNVPCVILRNETEWTEFVEKGKNILATTNPEKIISVVKELLSNPEKIKQIKSIVIKQEENTCRKIIEIIKNELLE